MKLMIVGATGLVGGHVLKMALAETAVTQVVAPARRALAAHPKLIAPQVDFAALPQDADWWQVDAVICALGTTIRTAGSKAAFTRVDHDYPLQVAQLAYAAGARTYVLNSALGADAQSRFFYNRTKGELERDLHSIGFDSLTFVRPGLIGGAREEFRLGERVMGAVLALTGPILPKQWQINPAQNIARAMLDAALSAKAGVQYVTSEALT